MVKSTGNYYHILGVDERSTPEDIKKAYRKLAVKYHPDRNPDNKAAEEQFKSISEAYAILSDPARKLEYDRERMFKAGPSQGQGPRPGGRGFTSTTQEEIFKEFFNNARSRQVFEELSKEFKRSGLRFDDKFFDKVFFGGRGFFFGGVFFSGQPGKERVMRDDRPDYRTTLSSKAKATSRSQPAPLIKPNPVQSAGKFLGKVGRGLVGLARTAFSIQEPVKNEEIPGPSDIRFNLTITAHQASSGADVEVAYQRNGKLQRVTVKVPAGTNDGAKLRLRGMGNGPDAAQSGDLFLNVQVVQ